MRPDAQDVARLWDMLSYAREIQDTLDGVSFAALDRDKNLRLATERRIEIIGEAARGLSQSFRDKHPGIPWRQVIAQRHRLAHEYGVVNDEMIWTIATVHGSRLMEQIEPLIPPS